MLPTAPTFELCAETLEACDAARLGGADRIELCAHLELDGLTPPDDLLAAAIERSGLPVHVLIRPEADNFIFRSDTFARMRQQIERAKVLGATGIVAGVLHPDRTVALEPTQELVALAAPLPLEFHRAFDRTPHLGEALEAVLAAGCQRVLTSGGAPDVLTGAAALDALVRQAGARIEIAAGGGLRLSNAAVLASQWTGQHYHGSLGGAADGTEALAQRILTLRQALQASHPLSA